MTSGRETPSDDIREARLGRAFLKARSESPRSTVEYTLNAELENLSRIILVPLASYFRVPKTLPASLPFSNGPAMDYAKTFCGGGNDCPDGDYLSDCAHFISHILAAGGAILSGPCHVCSKGLATSAVELHSAFINASEIYPNVHVHKSAEAQAGDFCFWLKNLGSKENHAFLLSGALETGGGGPAYAHTAYRCNTHSPFVADECVFYTIDDSA
jgi:hypothetical protein